MNTIQTGAAGAIQSSFLAGPFTIYFGFVITTGPITAMTMTPSSTLKYVGVSTILPSNPNKNQGYNAAVATDIVGNTFNIQRHVLLNLPIVYYMAIGL